MKLKDGELRIYYKDGKKVDVNIDDAIEDALKSFGYERWASGYNLVEGVRDIAFERRQQDDRS